MKATIRDTEVLNSVRPLDLVAYLRANKWQEAQRLEKGAFWIKEAEGETHEVLVPLDVKLRDFTNRVAEAILVLESAEQRSQLEILEDLTLTTADVVRPRLPSSDGEGTLSLEHGMIVYEHARNLMLAAACAAIEPKPLFAKRKPERVMEYLQHARFGIPKRGSYIVTIISPVPPKLTSGENLLVAEDEPFERRTVTLLANALAKVSNAAQQAAATGSIDAMKQAVKDGVSANLCEAILGLDEGGGNRGVEFTFSWSPTRQVSDQTRQRSHILFTPDAMPILKETARVFREIAVVESSEVIGMVQRLESRGPVASRATVIGTADETSRSVMIDVSGDENSKAIRAYENRIPVRCIGELVKEGKSWALQNPREFTLLNEFAQQSLDVGLDGL